MASKIKEHLKKNRLGTKTTKHVENVLISEPSDLQKTCFQMERLQKEASQLRAEIAELTGDMRHLVGESVQDKDELGRSAA